MGRYVIGRYMDQGNSAVEENLSCVFITVYVKYIRRMSEIVAAKPDNHQIFYDFRIFLDCRSYICDRADSHDVEGILRRVPSGQAENAVCRIRGNRFLRRLHKAGRPLFYKVPRNVFPAHEPKQPEDLLIA